MARRLRIQYADAIYHVMARGNAGGDIVLDNTDRQRLVDGLEKAVRRSGWVLYGFVIMTNHLHLVLKTPCANLAKGMQFFLSSYANRWARRHGRAGHLFQGRYRAEMVEDESYLWALTRYIHLNPVRAGMVRKAEDWLWSSYPGYVRRRQRFAWVAYDELLAAWSGEFGRTNPEASYRRFVAAGIKNPPPAPWSQSPRGWMIGSERFLDRQRPFLESYRPAVLRREQRLSRGVELGRILESVCRHYGIKRSELARRGSRNPARAAAAFLAREHSETTLAALAPILGVSRPESVPNLTKRFTKWLEDRADARRDLSAIESDLGLCGNITKI